jgi:cardiolipin synthase
MRRAKLRRIPRKWLIAGTTFVTTALIVLLVANLSLGDKHIEERVATLYSVADPQFRRNMNVMLGPPLVPGNRAQALVNGDQIFPDMLKAIGGARETITFESYIYWSGDTGAAFTQALIERARAGGSTKNR